MNTKERHIKQAKSSIVSGLIILVEEDPLCTSDIFEELEKKLWSLRIKKAGNDLQLLHNLRSSILRRLNRVNDKIREEEKKFQKKERLKREPELDLIFEEDD